MRRGPIYLVGLMASGKTTAGKLLARRLGLDFLDLDRAVERRARLSVAGIFKRFGEPGFRDREESALASAARRRGQVVATGGGVILRPANRRLLKKGICLHLALAPEAIVRRLGARELAKRPLFRDRKPLSVLRALVRQRARLYRQVSLARVAASGSPRQVVGRLEKRLQSLHLS